MGLNLSLALSKDDREELGKLLEDVDSYDFNRISAITKENGDVKAYRINELGEGLLEKLNSLRTLMDEKATVKIEMSETPQTKKITDVVESRLSRKVKDIHVFLSSKGFTSFDWHQDDEDVVMFVLRGSKRVAVKDLGDKHVNGKEFYLLRAGECLKLPKDRFHRVDTLSDDTIMISIGLV